MAVSINGGYHKWNYRASFKELWVFLGALHGI